VWEQVVLAYHSFEGIQKAKSKVSEDVIMLGCCFGTSSRI